MHKIFSDTRENIEDLKSLFLISSDLICVVDADGFFKRINPSFEKILGYSMEELITTPSYDFVYIGCKERTAEAIRQLRAGELVANFENRYICKDGSLVDISWSAKCVGDTIFAIGRDISMLKKIEKTLEDQHNKILIDSAKLCTLGEMALGIGHEIKNPVSIIQLISKRLNKLALEENISFEAISKYATQIDKTAIRIDKIVSGLKTLARNSEADPLETVNLKTIIEEMVELSVDQLKLKEVTLEVSNIDEAFVECRSSQIAQVILNLITNSCDAIEHSEKKWIKIEHNEDDNFHYLSVTDSGAGIPDELKETIFQSFYTSKTVGNGTGLGLSISKKIIESHGGNLFVDSKCKNTKFVISLIKPKKLAFAA